MFETIKEDFRQLRRGNSGSRFREFYEFRQRQRRPGLSPARVVSIVLGLTLVVGGASIGWLPGPGGFIAIFGLALLAQEFRPMATALDWCEPKWWTAWQAMVRAWRRLSASTQVVLAMTVVLTSVSMCYAAYSLFLR